VLVLANASRLIWLLVEHLFPAQVHLRGASGELEVVAIPYSDRTVGVLLWPRAPAANQNASRVGATLRFLFGLVGAALARVLVLTGDSQLHPGHHAYVYHREYDSLNPAQSRAKLLDRALASGGPTDLEVRGLLKALDAKFTLLSHSVRGESKPGGDAA
jgi:hypothetical protein